MADTPAVRYARTSDGVSLAYWTVGEGPYLIHSQPRVSNVQMEWAIAPIRSWYEQLGKRFTLVRFDRRGEGLSQREGVELSAEAALLDYEAIFDQLDSSSAAVLAVRPSGTEALMYVSRNPSRVSHLVMLNTVGEDAGTQGDSLASRANDANWAGTAELFAFRYLGWAQTEIGRQYTALIERSSTAEVIRRRAEADGQVDAAALRSTIDVPTLIIAGEGTDRPYEDRLRLDAARTLASDIRSAQLAVVSGLPISPWHVAADQGALADLIEHFVLPAPQHGSTSARSGAGGALQTILFTDLARSTAMQARLGDATAHEILRAHDAAVRTALEQFSGREVKHTGDGMMATFGSATDAVSCALQVRRDIETYNDTHDGEELRVRFGLNAGEPIAEDDDLFGLSVTLAARIGNWGEPGHVVVSNVVRELLLGKGFEFTSVGDATLKGFDEPVALYEVQGTP